MVTKMDLKNMKLVDGLFEKISPDAARKIDNGGTRPKRGKKTTAKKSVRRSKKK